jgi:uncharacterized protein YifN (PemK superfamily)
MNFLKKYWPDIAAILLFVVISFAYFMPADIDGRILYREDMAASKGMGQEQKEYFEKTGRQTRWNNSIFSGMPTYQISPSYSSTNVLNKVIGAYHLWLPENVWYIFAFLLGFYILLRAFDYRRELAILGSILWAFSSYFLIIIGAGHIFKVMALAYLPPLIAGVVLSYRGKYLWGFIVTAIFAAFEVKANHVQMTYYYLFIIFFMIIAFLVDAIRNKKLEQFFKATVVCFIGGALGVLINISNLYHTWQYSQESMRGKSELVKKDKANQTKNGLDRDYITQWSYGTGETWTLLVPNTKGGASVPLANNETAMKKADPNFSQIYQQIGQYWGDQPGTSGPVYVGAFVLMLFILSLFIVKGPMKWTLFAVTVLSILLSWGRNFMPFTNFFIDYFPMYSKFRTVASILVIAEFTIPLLAIMGLKKIVEEPDILTKKIKFVYISFALTAGIALLFAIMPGLFFSSYISTNEADALRQALPQQYLLPLMNNLTEMRKAIFTADCWRSFWIVVIGTFILLLYKAKKLKSQYMIGAIAILCLVDLWQVDKRYLNDSMFVESSVKDAPIEMTATDNLILHDKSLEYRVLNFASNTFNENETSYYHKSIGGYHPAKLHRYQDIIDTYIAPEMQKTATVVTIANGDMTKVNGDSIYPVLNMLNTKYFIFPLKNNQTVPITNPYAYGNAWFVDKISYVDNANEEIDKVGKISLRHEAVADKKFKEQLGDAIQQDNISTVTMEKYAPDELTYEVNSDKGGVVVFSEIYYPEWTVTVDGKPAQLGRADYILRALKVSAGKHEVVLTFHPKSIKVTESIAYVSSIILLLLIIAAGLIEWNRRKKIG